MQEKEILLNRIMSHATTEPWLKSIEMSRDSIRTIARAENLADIKKVYLTGGGTSLYSGQVGKAYIEKLAGISAEALPCYYLRQYTPDRLFDENVCIVGVSQMGGARSVAIGLEKGHKRGALSIAVSGFMDKEVPMAAEYVILTDAKRLEGMGVKSVAYTQANVALFLFALELGKANGHLSGQEADYWENQLQLTIKKAAELSGTKSIMDELAGCYFRSQVNFVLASGPNQGTAEEGALKIIEMGWVTGEAEDLEDFLHGRYREVDTKTPMFILAPKGGSTEKMLDAISTASRIGVPTIVLTDEKDARIEKFAKHIVHMPGGIDEFMTPLLYIVPLWLYGYQVGVLRGGDPSGNRYGFLPTSYRFCEHYDEQGNPLKHEEPPKS